MDIEDLARALGAEIIRVDPGDMVVCDLCNRDFTTSPESGGIYVETKSVGPCCAARYEKNLRECGELQYLRARCPDGMPFADWVRRVLR